MMLSPCKETQCVVQAPMQPPTAATGGDGVVVLENSLPTDLQIAPGPQLPIATTVGGDGQQNNDGKYELLVDFDHFLLL